MFSRQFIWYSLFHSIFLLLCEMAKVPSLQFWFYSKSLFPPSLFRKAHGKSSTKLKLIGNSASSGMEENAQFKSLKTLDFPTPLSPPLPLISKQIELNRALTASSKSDLFVLSSREIIFEDKYMIIINKPSGIYCDCVLSSTHAFLKKRNLDLGTEEQPSLELHLANRLDRDTSGVMIITKSHKVAAKLVKAFTDHKVKKTYIALCIGTPPKWEAITLQSGHGRSKHGAWRVYSASDVGRKLPGGSLVKDMITSFEVLSINGQGKFQEPNRHRFGKTEVMIIEERAPEKAESDCEDEEILIRAYPQSGRTHQIRLHCQYLGISITGDVKYEGRYEWKGKTFNMHTLHAESLLFDHPITGTPVSVQAPLPLWVTTTLE